VKDIKVGVEKMTRNCRKMIKQTGDSLLFSKHSIQLSALFLLLSGHKSVSPWAIYVLKSANANDITPSV
jgi:hypothetical protein